MESNTKLTKPEIIREYNLLNARFNDLFKQKNELQAENARLNRLLNKYRDSISVIKGGLTAINNFNESCTFLLIRNINNLLNNNQE